MVPSDPSPVEARGQKEAIFSLVGGGGDVYSRHLHEYMTIAGALSPRRTSNAIGWAGIMEFGCRPACKMCV